MTEKSKVAENRKTAGRPKGLPKTGGRAKGTPNKDKQELIALIESVGCKHPIIGLAEIARQSHESGELDRAANCYKELAQYVAPKRKAIEHSGGQDINITEGETLAERLTGGSKR